MNNKLAGNNAGNVSLDETLRIGEIFVKSGFFSDAKDAAQAIVKILAGKELGFGPMASMTGVYIVKGKVTLSANLMAAALKRTGHYNYRVRTMTDEVCEVEFFEHSNGSWESVGKSRFSMDDAKRANLINSSAWRAYPRNMLFARALSNGVKWYCPDIFGGPIYTPDELGAVVDGETGNVVGLPEPPEEQPKDRTSAITEKQYKMLHAIGKKLYGDEWDERRVALVTWVTKGAYNSSNDLTVDEASVLIDGMKKKLESQAKQSPDEVLKQAAAENPDSIYADQDEVA